MQLVQKEMNFIQPKPRPELNGELGLTVGEIAASLGVAAKTLRRKIEARQFLERLNESNFKAVPFGTANSVNGLGFTDYVFDLNAARFIVAKYNNAVGDAYLAYLIRLDEAVSAGANVSWNEERLKRLVAATVAETIKTLQTLPVVKEPEQAAFGTKDRISTSAWDTEIGVHGRILNKTVGRRASYAYYNQIASMYQVQSTKDLTVEQLMDLKPRIQSIIKSILFIDHEKTRRGA